MTSGSNRGSPSLVSSIALGAMAGGMGWGIRGQYGHETGAMIAGVLLGLTLVMLFHPDRSSLSAARAAAWCAVAISFGGCMTYGQTVGLTHDPPLVGNWAALRWGMLGLLIKGGVWFGFAATFLGMGLGGVRYRPRELGLLLLAMLALLAVGVYLLNEPYAPERRLLPRFYFSDHWMWEPDTVLKPRRERWGGLLFALAGLLVYVRWFRHDRLAFRLGGWGFLAGGLGFPIGQSLQAYHAWNLDWFRNSWMAAWDPRINWWNMMETTFGAIAGAVLALGLWRNRHLVSDLSAPSEEVSLSPAAEWGWVSFHVVCLGLWSFFSLGPFDAVADWGIPMGVVPLLGIAGGRYWPHLLLLPITAIPIAGRTLEHLQAQKAPMSLAVGAAVYVVLPLLLTTALALGLARDARGRTASGRDRVVPALLLAIWLYFGLNFAFFRFPWPWEEWTYRTPNGMLFLLCASGLSLAALARWGLAGRPVNPRDEPACECKS